MGLFDVFEVKCECGETFYPQTKLVKYAHLHTWRVGEYIPLPFLNSRLELKDKCPSCGKVATVLIRDGEIKCISTGNLSPTHIEKSFGNITIPKPRSCPCPRCFGCVCDEVKGLSPEKCLVGYKCVCHNLYPYEEE